MRKIVLILTLLALLTLRVSAQELLEQEAEILERWQEEDGISVHVLTEEQWGAFQTLTERLYDPEDPDHQDWFADCTPEWVEQFRPS